MVFREIQAQRYIWSCMLELVCVYYIAILFSVWHVCSAHLFLFRPFLRGIPLCHIFFSLLRYNFVLLLWFVVAIRKRAHITLLFRRTFIKEKAPAIHTHTNSVVAVARCTFLPHFFLSFAYVCAVLFCIFANVSVYQCGCNRELRINLLLFFQHSKQTNQTHKCGRQHKKGKRSK